MEDFLLSPAAGVLIRVFLLWGPLLVLAAVFGVHIEDILAVRQAQAAASA